MHTYIEISSEALLHNYHLLAQRVGGESKLMPVLKGNAYGHGLKEVLQILAHKKPAGFCLNYLSEAQTVRLQGWQGRILLVGPLITSEELVCAFEHSCEILLSGPEITQLWLHLPVAVRPKAHLKLDTGMRRLGFTKDQLPSLLEDLEHAKHLIVGAGTHFADVRPSDQNYIAENQRQTFASCLDMLRQRGFHVETHASASAPTLTMPQAHFDICRPGLALYGLWLQKNLHHNFLEQTGHSQDLQPVLSLRTRIATIKHVNPGEKISYGGHFTAQEPLRMAVLSTGYAENTPRLAWDKGHVLIHSQPCPLLGSVCMHMAMVDVTKVPQAKAGDQATLIGWDQSAYIGASDWAQWSQTICYETVTCLNRDIPRRITP